MLEVRSADHEVVLPMRDATFTYSYRQSIYDVLVREDLRVVDTSLRTERAASTDLRALEYFRWPGAPVEVGAMLEWPAPPLAAVGRLDIAVVEQGEQVIDTGVRRARLRDAVGEGSVTVMAAYRPLAVWLWSLIAWR